MNDVIEGMLREINRIKEELERLHCAETPLAGAGAGDVVGPAGAADGHLAVYDGITGKRIKDGGVVPIGDVVGPAGATGNHLAVFDGATGKLIKDGGVVPVVSPQTAIFSIESTIAVGSKALRIYNTTGVTRVISKVFIAVNTTPTGAAIIVDIHKNGTTIFTTQSNRPQITATNFTGQSTTIENANWEDGQYITLEIDQVGSTLPGSDLTVHILST